MSRKKEILCHILFWFLFVGLDELLRSMRVSKDLDPLWVILHHIGFLLLQLLIFYLNYLIICPRTIPFKKWYFLILAELSLVLLFPFLRFIYEEIFLFKITGNHNYNMETLTPLYYICDNSYYSIRVLLFSLVGYFMKYLWNTSAQMNQLTLEKKHAELQVLKNQLSPHFLFNSLNGFYSDLYDTNPEVAADIMKLSEMLRYVTYESKNDIVSLKDETMFLKNYIDLFKRRFDGMVAIDFIHSDNLGNHRIPSLMLIHFLENALKHGISDDFENPITIKLKIENGRFIFTSENKYRIIKSYDEHGIGNKNISQRLSLMYPDNHTLIVSKDDNYHKVTLNMPLS
ncbi:sensor histidine kinase [Flavobacterium collinsii]|uniref:His_kinase domain-containing protein n=3 Tax=Flavobacterium collinsii TaxID=1114861 RepID=A0A9W4XAV3_9FLAO|nr:histidine kinase [Flavobacterium collinsii]CAI2768178.1 His_kinase domain-containing protein [Flavobacterium collinsii]